MKILVGNFESITTRRGLYCVWAPAVEGESTPLVARWIDPNAARENNSQEETPELADVESRRRYLRLYLRAA